MRSTLQDSVYTQKKQEEEEEEVEAVERRRIGKEELLWDDLKHHIKP